jgi:hypothetical protein
MLFEVNCCTMSDTAMRTGDVCSVQVIAGSFRPIVIPQKQWVVLATLHIYAEKSLCDDDRVCLHYLQIDKKAEYDQMVYRCSYAAP